MAILSSLQGLNLFSSPPSTPPPNDTSSSSSPSLPQPPIPFPKYPPPSPAFKIPHRRTKYYKPVNSGVIAADGDRSVVVGENGVSYLLPGAPFEFQYSYSETPNVKPIAIREPAFLPFAPPSMPRPWTGKAPLKKKADKKIPLFSHGNRYETAVRFPYGKYPGEVKSREEILGPPLKKWEIKMLVKPHLSDNRQVNLGRDGLTHNMLELIHTHWRRSAVCKVRCKGVPTVDMDNICYHLEEKTQGKIIHRVGGVVYLFRGRNYDHQNRPRYPMMIWKPAAPVYPKLIEEAPEGLTKAEADELREKGKNLLPICKLAKNGVYITLPRDVRTAFEGTPLVKVDCKGMHATDYKKLGAKLKELVPCVLLSFEDEQILMWRGQNWKSKYPKTSPVSIPAEVFIADGSEESGKSDDEYKPDPDANIVSSSPKMMSLWKHAIESSKAMLLEEIHLGPDALLSKIEEFDSISQANEHSYPALVLSSKDAANYPESAFKDGSLSENFSEDNVDNGDEYEDDFYESDSFEDIDDVVPLGSLTVDQIAERLEKDL